VARLISPSMVQESCAMALQWVWLCTILCPWKSSQRSCYKWGRASDSWLRGNLGLW